MSVRSPLSIIREQVDSEDIELLFLNEEILRDSGKSL